MKWSYLVLLSAAALLEAGLLVASAADQPSLDDALASKISFSVIRNSLELTAADLSTKVKSAFPDFAIKLIADDLKVEGFTRNMAVRDLTMKDATVSDVLTEMLMKTDPNDILARRGIAPSNPRIGLVWVVAPDPADATRKIVLITTRAGAKRRGNQLPKVFQEK